MVYCMESFLCHWKLWASKSIWSSLIERVLILFILLAWNSIAAYSSTIDCVGRLVEGCSLHLTIYQAVMVVRTVCYFSPPTQTPNCFCGKDREIAQTKDLRWISMTRNPGEGVVDGNSVSLFPIVALLFHSARSAPPSIIGRAVISETSFRKKKSKKTFRRLVALSAQQCTVACENAHI